MIVWNEKNLVHSVKLLTQQESVCHTHTLEKHQISRKLYTIIIMIYEAHLGLCDAEALEQLWVFDGQLNDFLYLFDLLVEPSDHVVGGVRNFLHHHQTHQGVYLRGERERDIA